MPNNQMSGEIEPDDRWQFGKTMDNPLQLQPNRRKRSIEKMRRWAKLVICNAEMLNPCLQTGAAQPRALYSDGPRTSDRHRRCKYFAS